MALSGSLISISIVFPARRHCFKIEILLLELIQSIPVCMSCDMSNLVVQLIKAPDIHYTMSLRLMRKYSSTTTFSNSTKFM